MVGGAIFSVDLAKETRLLLLALDLPDSDAIDKTVEDDGRGIEQTGKRQ